MKAQVKILRSNKQVIELLCVIVSLSLVFLNIYMSDLYPNRSSVAAAINYSRLSSEQQWEGNGLGANVTEVASEEGEDPFTITTSFNKIIKANLENRSKVVSDVCR